MKYLPRIIIGLFVALALVGVGIIIQLANTDKEAFLPKEIKSTVILIRQGYKGKPNYKIMELQSGQSFTVPESMLYVLEIGDSVYKNKGEDFYTFISSKTKKIKKVGMR
jgi:hypothetical protein